MKCFPVIILLFALVGCAPLPESEVRAMDRDGKPLSGLPIRMEFSAGMTAYSLPRDLAEELPDGQQVLDLRTDENGRAAFGFSFNERQSSSFRNLFPGSKWVPNQLIKITPMKDLPKGSSISFGISNP